MDSLLSSKVWVGALYRTGIGCNSVDRNRGRP